MLIERPEKARPIRKMPTDPKPVLEVQRVPVFRVHYTALEAYVREVFGFNYNFLAAAGVSDGVAVDFHVRGSALNSIAWETRANALRQGRRDNSPVLILNVLARDGYIADGLYTVSTTPLPDPTEVYTGMLQHGGNPASPECVKFKIDHRNDRVFTERAVILDKAFSDQQGK